MPPLTSSKSSPSSNPLSLEHLIGFPVYAASNIISRIYQFALEPLGITYSQYLVMLVLWENNGLMVTEIGKILRLDTGTLTPLIKRLEGIGMVERHRLSDDKRRVIVLLTKQGQELRNQALQLRQKMVKIFEDFGSPEEIAKLKKDVYHLLKQMDGYEAAIKKTL